MDYRTHEHIPDLPPEVRREMFCLEFKLPDVDLEREAELLCAELRDEIRKGGTLADRIGRLTMK